MQINESRSTMALQLRGLLAAALLLSGCGKVSGGNGIDGGAPDSAAVADGAPACPVGQARCSDVCMDITADPASCGACGHDCGGGSCSGGACEAMALVEGLPAPFAIAVTPDHSQVFYQAPIEVGRCAATGCAQPTRIAEFGLYTPVRIIDQIVTTELEVFWLGRNPAPAILSCPASGCGQALPQVKDGHELPANVPRAMTYAEGSLLVTERFNGLQCEVAGGCSVLEAVYGDSLQTFTIAGDTAYFLENTDPGGLYASPRAGGSQALRLTAERGKQLRLHDGALYVLRQAGTGIYRCTSSGCSGVGNIVVADETDITSMDVAEHGVYWTTSAGEVKQCPVAGCDPNGPRILATGQDQPLSVIAAGDFIYWVNRGAAEASTGALMRIRI